MAGFPHMIEGPCGLGFVLRRCGVFGISSMGPGDGSKQKKEHDDV